MAQDNNKSPAHIPEIFDNAEPLRDIYLHFNNFI